MSSRSEAIALWMYRIILAPLVIALLGWMWHQERQLDTIRQEFSQRQSELSAKVDTNHNQVTFQITAAFGTLSQLDQLVSETHREILITKGAREALLYVVRPPEPQATAGSAAQPEVPEISRPPPLEGQRLQQYVQRQLQQQQQQRAAP